MFKVSDVLDRRHVVPGLAAPDKAALLTELARRAAVALKRDKRVIVDALLQREGLGSTGVGGGIAIPHARIPGLAQIFGMFFRLEPAMDFAAIDGAPVDLVFLILTPAESSSAHLACLAAVSRRMREPDVVGAVRRAATAKEIYAAIAA